MLGNGIANIIAALIVAAALVWSGGVRDRGPEPGMSEEEFAKWYARAVGDIRNDIVVNCGCCGDEGTRKAAKESF